jgi:hypothetical protein
LPRGPGNIPIHRCPFASDMPRFGIYDPTSK